LAFNISATAEISNFKFGTLGFAKVHHKIARIRKGGRGPGIGELPKILGFRFSISETAEARDFKLCTQSHHKSHPEEKVG